MAAKKLTTVVIGALEDIKARDIMLINVAKLTSVFDYIAVASADSTRQTKALARHVMDQVKEYGGWIYGIEGEQSGEWVLVDCGDVVVHIMQPAVREHYKLEELWGEGKVEFPKPVAPKRQPAPPEAVEKAKAGTKAKSTKTAAAKPKVKVEPKAKPKLKAKVKVKVKTTKAKVMVKTTQAKTTKPRVAKTRIKAATATVGKEKKAVAKTKMVTKKLVATTRKKAATTAIKKPAVKKVAVKKPAAKKPMASRRKAGA